MFVTILPNGRAKFQERYKDFLTGKWKTASITMEKDTNSTRKLAAAELARIIADKYDYTPTKQYTLAELLACYVEHQQETLKSSTVVRNQIINRKMIELLGSDAIVDNLSANYVRDKIKHFPVTKQRSYLTRFKAMIHWGYENELTDNYALVTKLKLPEDKEQHARIADKYLEPEAVTALLEAMTIPDWQLLTKFLLLSGLRIGEAIALTRADLDERYIHVMKTYDMVNEKITTPKTDTSTRDVFIQPELAAILKDIRKNELEKQLLYSRKSKLLFTAQDGGFLHYDAYRQYLLDTSARSIGRSITPHALRHTHASLLLSEGIDIDSISRRLGHSDSKVTKEIYLHMTEKLKIREEDAISKIQLLGS